MDRKAITVDADGLVVDGATDDRCASGTGGLYEVLARALECEVDGMGELALCGTQELDVSSTCAGRALASVAQVGREVPVVVTGGVAQTPAAVAFLSAPSTTLCSCPSGPGSPGRTAPRCSPWSPWAADSHGHLATPSPIIGLGPVRTR